VRRQMHSDFPFLRL